MNTRDPDAATQKRAEQARGDILQPAFRLPGIGRLPVVTYTSGAVIGLIEPEGTVGDLRSPVHSFGWRWRYSPGPKEGFLASFMRTLSGRA